MPKVLRLLALLAFTAPGAAFAADAGPPAPAELAETARLADGLFPVTADTDEAYAATLKSARAAGITENRLLESEIYRALIHRVKSSDCLALAARLEKVAAGWKREGSEFIDGPALAGALVHALRARHALIAGNDIAKFRTEAAEAVWRSTRLADLIAEIETERSRDALLATPAFMALAKATAAGDEAGARRTFDEAFWSSPPLSCDLAVEKVDGMRDAKAEPEPESGPVIKSAGAAPAEKRTAFAAPDRRAPFAFTSLSEAPRQ